MFASLACTSSCARRAHPPTAAPPPTVAPPVAPIPKPECVVDGDDLDLPLALHSGTPLSRNSLLFAQVWHAKHAKMILTDDEPRLSVEIETSMLRLHGVAAIEEAHFYPASVSIFGETRVPLATNKLEWHATAHDEVSLSPGKEPGTSAAAAPEWRACSYVRLRPEPAFDLDRQLGVHRTKRAQLEPGGYGLYPDPESLSSHVTLYLNGKEVIWLLEDRGKHGGRHWMKILYEAPDTAFVGWIDSAAVGASLGHGSGTGTSKRATCTAPRMDCEVDVTLLASVEGTLTEIGTVKSGAAITIEQVKGDYAEVHVCDPDVELFGTIVIRAGEAHGCFLFPQKPRGDR